MLTVSKRATGKRIRKYMDAKGYSCTTLGMKIGCVRSTVWEWTSGRALPSIDSMGKLVQLFGCGFDDLICFGKD